MSWSPWVWDEMLLELVQRGEFRALRPIRGFSQGAEGDTVKRKIVTSTISRGNP